MTGSTLSSNPPINQLVDQINVQTMANLQSSILNPALSLNDNLQANSQ